MTNAGTSEFAVMIGGYRFDIGGEQLVDPVGQPVSLRPKSSRLLAVLASRPEQIIDKDALMEAVWGDIHVTEDSLTKCARDIRLALAADGARLETVPRRGYRLRAAAVAPHADLGLRIHVGALEEISGDPRWQRIANGLGRELADTLADNAWVSVTTGDLNSDTGLELSGDLFVDAGRARINLRLTDLPTGEIVWTDRRVVSDTDPFEMIDAITGSVVGALGSFWSGSHALYLKSRLRHRTPANLGAFENWMLATESLLQFTPAGLHDALALSTRAIDIDPEYAQAWALLAIAHQLLMSMEPTREARAAHAIPHREAALRAEELGPDILNCRLAGAYAYALDGQYEEARLRVDQAVLEHPRNPDILAMALIWSGFWYPLEHRATDWEAGIRAHLAKPRHFHTHAFATAAWHRGDYAETIELLRPSPFPVMNSVWTISAAIRTSDASEVEAARERFQKGAPGDITISEVLDAHGTHHPDLRAGLLADCRKAGLTI